MLPTQDQRLRDAVRKYFPVYVDKSVSSSSEQMQREDPDSASESTPTDAALSLPKCLDIEVTSFPPKVHKDFHENALPSPVETIVIATTEKSEKSEKVVDTAVAVAILGEFEIRHI